LRIILEKKMKERILRRDGLKAIIEKQGLLWYFFLYLMRTIKETLLKIFAF
jgi:hypothetical protein